jgi:hypothetical protein
MPRRTTGLPGVRAKVKAMAGAEVAIEEAFLNHGTGLDDKE